VSIVGRQVSGPLYNGDMEENIAWIGKPWRRLELLVQRTFWKGECVDRTWTASASLGLRRLGWHLHIALTRQVGQDYSDEPQ